MRRSAIARAAWVVPAALLATACGARTVAPSAEGRATPIAPPAASIASASADRAPIAGRAPRRLGVAQLRVAIEAATGFAWEGLADANDPDHPGRRIADPHADLVGHFGATLGTPDYLTSTSESLAPSIPFMKLVGDAARSSCKRAVAWDASHAEKRIAKYAPLDAGASRDAAAVRKNAAYLALRIWGRAAREDDPDVARLVDLYDAASKGGAPADGWRAVCIAMITDPQFLTY